LVRGDKLTLPLKLQPDTEPPPTPLLLIVTDPPGARVSINHGALTGFGGDRFKVPPGKFRLRVEKEGFITRDEEIDRPREDVLHVKLLRAVRVLIRPEPAQAKVKVNGDLVTDLANLVLPPGSHTVRVELPGYKTKEETIVLGESDKQREFAIVLEKEPVVAEPAEQRALLVGVRAPTAELPVFVYAGADVKDLGHLLRAAGAKPANIKVLTDADAGTGPIRQALGQLTAAAQRDDLVVVALAGHAVRLGADKTVYFCPASANLSARDTLLPLEDVFQALQKCKARHKLVLLDLWRADAYPPPPLPAGVSRARPQDIAAVPGLALLLSCSGDEQGQEHLGPLQRHGAFFEFTMRGLMGDAAPGKPQVTAGELQDYLAKTVPAYTQKAFATSQTPRWLDDPKAPVKDAVLLQRNALVKGVYQGLVALEQNRLDGALKALTDAEKQGGAPWPELFLLRAAVNYYLGDKDSKRYYRALEDCAAALKVDPGQSKAWSFRGEVYLELAGEGRRYLAAYDKALECHSTAIELEPCSQNYRGRGLTYVGKGDRLEDDNLQRKALADFTEAVRLQPRSALPLFNRGVLYLYFNKIDEALNDLSRAIALENRDPQLYFYRAVARYRKMEDEGALRRLPGRKRDFSTAIEDFNQAIKLNDQVPEFWNFRGLCLAADGQFDQAIADYTRTLALLGDKPSAQVLINRGIAYHEKGNQAKAEDKRKYFLLAVEDFQAALKVDGSSYQAWLNLSRTYTALGETAKAKMARDMAEKVKKR
jgi:tetratricopeptide (TPR) repeat protein